jgi:hypothetical protein
MIFAVVDGDRLPCSISYCILVSGSESWTLVTVHHIWSAEDLHDCLVLFSSRAWNSLDSELRRSGDVEAVQQIPQSASGIEASFLAVLISLASRYVCSFSASLKGALSSASLYSA